MGAMVLYVYDLDEKFIGYTRWQNTADVYETHGIYLTGDEAGDRRNSINPGDRTKHDVVVQICDRVWSPEKQCDVPIFPGHRVWANLEKMVVTDDGFWVNPNDAYDYGYVDVDSTNPYRYYEPVPIDET